MNDLQKLNFNETGTIRVAYKYVAGAVVTVYDSTAIDTALSDLNEYTAISNAATFDEDDNMTYTPYQDKVNLLLGLVDFDSSEKFVIKDTYQNVYAFYNVINKPGQRKVDNITTIYVESLGGGGGVGVIPK